MFISINVSVECLFKVTDSCHRTLRTTVSAAAVVVDDNLHGGDVLVIIVTVLLLWGHGGHHGGHGTVAIETCRAVAIVTR